MVPKTLDWKGELAKLMPFLRTLFWVYGAFIAIFWGVRLVVQLFVFDASEFLTTWYFKLGYHVLTATFIYQTGAYGYCAFK